MCLRAVLIVLSLSNASMAWAADVFDLPLVRSGVVREVTDPLVLILNDGSTVRLASVAAAPGRHEDRARRGLSDLARGRFIEIRYAGGRQDRHGRLVGHVVRDDGLWLQEDMVRRGLVHVLPLPGEAQLASALLLHERRAREERRGQWSDTALRPIEASEASRGDAGRFRIVEGVVLDAADVRGTIYLNFGQDWRTDFTVMIPREASKTFVAAGIEPLSLEKRSVRVRGWMRSLNGAMIVVEHPEWLETLGTQDNGGR